MQKTTLLVTGRFGFVGRIGNSSVDITLHFDNLWVLRHDGTPQGYISAWENAKLNYVQNISAKMQEMNPDVTIIIPKHGGCPYLLPTGFSEGINGAFQYLSVVEKF